MTAMLSEYVFIQLLNVSNMFLDSTLNAHPFIEKYKKNMIYTLWAGVIIDLGFLHFRLRASVLNIKGKQYITFAQSVN